MDRKELIELCEKTYENMEMIQVQANMILDEYSNIIWISNFDRGKFALRKFLESLKK